MSQNVEIDLFRFTADSTKWEFSPWCNKLETLFAMTGTKFTIQSTMANKGPRGKVPFIDVKTASGETERIPDSEYAYNQLVKRGVVDDLDKDLSEEQRAVNHMIKVTMDELVAMMSTER